jgi:hypothetical protein
MAVEFKTFEKGDPAWLELRSKFITATEVASLFALNSYSSPTKMYEEKICSTFQDNEYTRMGRMMEPAVFNFAAEIIGRSVHPFASNGNTVYFDNETHVSATPDAYVSSGMFNSPDAIALLEAKATSRKSATKWVTEPPLHYLMQLATQSYLVGMDIGYLAILVPEYPLMPGLIFKTTYMPEIGVLIEEEVARFRKHFFWDLPKDKPVKSYRCDTAKCKLMRQLLIKNLTIVHDDFTVEEVMLDPWD